MKLNVLLGDAYKEGMTADEIISALEKVADPNAEVEKLRNAVTKANGEAAEYKKQLKAKRTDDENAAQEQADKLAEMQKQIEALTADKENLVKEKTLASYREKFVAQGYDAELANKAASALADGDMDKVFKFQSEFMTAHDTAYKASLLKDMPTPPGADGKGGSDSEGVAFAKSLAQQFLSTPSARRATSSGLQAVSAHEISIHALREEGDRSAGCRSTADYRIRNRSDHSSVR